MKNSLTVPGIINIILSFFWLMSGVNDSISLLTIGVFVLVSGIICIIYSKLNPEELFEKRSVILTFAIILIPFNIITAIILFAEYDKIKGEYYKYLKEKGNQIPEIKNNMKVEKEVKKVDILLKLGIAMVSISGIMIATTSWEVITDFAKMIIIALIGLVFLGLSYFSDKKLKIKGTTITYWLLSMIAFSLSIFMIGYYQFFGEWFSIDGDGSDVFVATLFLIISLFSYLTYKKFDIKAFLNGTFLGIILSISLVVNYISKEPELSLLIISIILTVINFLPKYDSKEIKVIKAFSMITTFVITAILILAQLSIENKLIVMITLVFQIINLVRISVLEKNDAISILSSISLLGLIASIVNIFELELDDIYSLLLAKGVFLISTVFVCLTILKNHKRNNILLSVIVPLSLVSILFEINFAVALFIGIISIAMIILGFVNKEYKAVYIEGIIFTILNLIIQLWELWGILPVWAYLLIGGLSLIGVVTFKELKKE